MNYLFCYFIVVLRFVVRIFSEDHEEAISFFAIDAQPYDDMVMLLGEASFRDVMNSMEVAGMAFWPLVFKGLYIYLSDVLLAFDVLYLIVKEVFNCRKLVFKALEGIPDDGYDELVRCL